MSDYTTKPEIGQIWLFGGIKGLVKDGEVLAEDLRKLKPDVIIITLSDEHILGLRDFLLHPYEIELSDYEIIYGVRLSMYGEVMTPPPVYIEAVKYSDSFGIPIVPVDMNEESYGELYTKSMKTLDLVRHSIRKKRLLKKDYKDKNVEQFVRNWERTVNKIKGLRIIDEERLAYIEDKIRSALFQYSGKSVFIIVDFEFVDRVEKFLKDGDFSFTRIYSID
ncbi:hypothetical protein Thermo_01451 [Thermoplasmatales archaeon]|nr:hypothetical protein Thermo_01451 [Thermoplasmatales archaeon]